MKIALLTFAMFLACIVNGLLLYEAFALEVPQTQFQQAQTQIAVPTPTPAPVAQVKSEATLSVTVVSNHWFYKARQPVRNLVRYVHNKYFERDKVVLTLCTNSQ